MKSYLAAHNVVVQAAIVTSESWCFSKEQAYEGPNPATLDSSLSVAAVLWAMPLWAAPTDVSFSQSAAKIEAYDFVEVTAQLASPDAANPFTDASLTGWFAKTGGAERTAVEGFCDSDDGGLFRIRFMPSTPGDYTYSVTFRQGDFEKTHYGNLPGHRRPPPGPGPR